MTERAWICPRCRKLNSPADRQCYQCGANSSLAGGARLSQGVRGWLGAEQPAARFYLYLCVGVYLVTTARALLNEGSHFSPLGGLSVVEALRWGALGGGASEPWRYLSAMFVHFGVLHIGFNMLTLNTYGRLLEPKLGSGRFVCAFLITGIVGFVASSAWYAWLGRAALTAGASGGLLGLIGVVIGLLYAQKSPAWRAELTNAVVSILIMAIAFPVNNAAHVGGMITGALLGYWFGSERQARARTVWYNRCAAILVVASLLSIGASYVSVEQHLSAKGQHSSQHH